MRRIPAAILALTLVFAVAPATAGALELAHDDGTMEMNEWYPAGIGHAVHFDLPTADAYDLLQVSIYLMNGAPQTFGLVVQVWDQDLNIAYTLPVGVEYTAPAWYTLDLAAAGVAVSGSFRVGVFQDGTVTGPFFGGDVTAPTGNSFFYGEFPDPLWFQIDQANYGIRATVEPAAAPPAPAAPVLACEGFGPPMHRAIRLHRGARALPLKARLLDAAGAVVGADGLVAPPAVQVLFTPEGGEIPVDVTASVGPAGCSGDGHSFRYTDEGTWRYNLKTRSFADAGDYEVRLVSGDPAEYVVDPACSAVVTVGAGMAPKGRGGH